MLRLLPLRRSYHWSLEAWRMPPGLTQSPRGRLRRAPSVTLDNLARTRCRRNTRDANKTHNKLESFAWRGLACTHIRSLHAHPRNRGMHDVQHMQIHPRAVHAAAARAERGRGAGQAKTSNRSGHEERQGQREVTRRPLRCSYDDGSSLESSAYLTPLAKVLERRARFCKCLTKPGAVSAKQNAISSPPMK